MDSNSKYECAEQHRLQHKHVQHIHIKHSVSSLLTSHINAGHDAQFIISQQIGKIYLFPERYVHVHKMAL